MRKYFFFDIDGTLTTPLTADYPKSAQETIRKLKEQGHLVAIATGRMQADAAEVAEKLGIDTIVSDGGNAVTENGKIYFHKSLPINSSFSLLDDLDIKKHPWAVAPMNKKYRKTRCINYLQKVVDRYYETEVDPNYDYHSEDTLYKIFISWTNCQIKCNTYGKKPKSSSLGVLYFIHFLGLLFINFKL